MFINQGFPGGAVVKNPPASAGDRGSIPGQGTKILRAMRCSQNKNKNKNKKHSKDFTHSYLTRLKMALFTGDSKVKVVLVHTSPKNSRVY